MPLPNAVQPDEILINETIRLVKYDGNYEIMLPGYQDPYVYQNSEGIFDDAKKPDLSYIKRMTDYLSQVGEFYFIEIWEDGTFRRVGDVTIKQENPPIAIWYERYRHQGIGTLVMKTVIKRLRELGYQEITDSVVYKWNDASLRMHQKLGFRIVDETEKEYKLNLRL